MCDKVNAPYLSNIENVLGLTLPVVLTPEMSHLHLAQGFSSLVNVRNIWIYDNIGEISRNSKGSKISPNVHGTLLNSQPFTSYANAQESIGLPRTSVAVRRNIDTGKAYLNRYTFYSYPTSPASQSLSIDNFGPWPRFGFWGAGPPEFTPQEGKS
jgi:hypothetical protein